MPPFWFKLLSFQRLRGLTGLTVPFLVGATRDPIGDMRDDTRNYLDFCQLLSEFQDTKIASHYVRISECTTLHQPIVAVYCRSDRPNPQEHLVNHAGNGNLFVSEEYWDHATLDSIVSRLWILSKTSISRGEFSFGEGHYRSFNEADHKFIQRAAKSV